MFDSSRVKQLVFAMLLGSQIVFCLSAHAVVDERRKPQEPVAPKPKVPEISPKEPKIKADDRILVKALDGVRFLADPKDVVKQDLDLLGIEIVNVPLLDSDAFREKIKPFLGKPVSLASIKRLAYVAIKYFHENNRPFVDVSVPEQDITGGVIQLLVTEARLGEIRVEGHKYYSSKRYKKAIHLETDGTIDEKRLIRDLNYFNKNAFRQIKPFFLSGKKPGTTDLVLKAQERFPVRFYTGYEDTGSQTTGLDRLLVGFNWGDGFYQDHEIGYQYSTDIEFERLQSHSGYWRIPLPNRHKLAITAGYSKTQAHITDVLFNPAVNWQVGLRYQMPLKDLGEYSHQLDMGFDFKQSQNNLEFGGLRVFDSEVDTAQFALQYAGSHFDPLGSTRFSLSGIFSPGHLTTNQRTEDYTRERAGTDPQYGYGRMDLERTWKLPKGITLWNHVYGQVATNRLQSTEQLLLGGFNSVRGYDDRLTATDEGVQVNVELRSPDFMLGRIGGDDRFENRLQFIAFYDFGWGHNKGRFAGEENNIYLDSIGGGLRYRMGTHISARFDYGHLLQSLKGGLVGSDHGRIHLSVVVSF